MRQNNQPTRQEDETTLKGPLHNAFMVLLTLCTIFAAYQAFWGQKNRFVAMFIFAGLSWIGVRMTA